ncbi:MAG: WXG100 family type VII secretion target [Rhodococcus sp.]|nr:WXG100 family type VII secretion target [Rhodococcus sp. (in: high G+C Gram-positive bacteria)]
MSEISYEFAAMDQMAGDIRNRVVALNETHEELKGYVNGLSGAWKGEAQEGYAAVQQQWDSAHSDLIMVLETIAKVVEDGTADMRDKEKMNAAMWG